MKWFFIFMIVFVVCVAASTAWNDYLDAKYPRREDANEE